MEQTSSGGIAIYLREDSQQGDGEAQLALCREYCRLHYGEEVEDGAIYRDAFSPSGHPGLDSLLADAREGRVGVIVCAGLDKVSYNTAELASLLEELGGLSVTFVSVNDRLSTDTPLGRAMGYLAASLSRLDRQGAARRVRDGMLELARTGRWLGGVTPTGYQSKKIKARGGATEYALTPIPGEVAVVRRIFDAFLEYNSLMAVERSLGEAGVRSKNNRAYSRFSIRQILENPVYALADRDVYDFFRNAGAEICTPAERFDSAHGMMVYNKTVQQQGSGKSRDISQWIVAVGRHEGIIPGAEWVKAQRQLGQNKPGSLRKPRSAHALLPGILRCGRCGAFMRPKQTQRLTEDGAPVFIYLCERKERSNSAECQIKNVSGNALDRIVCDQLRGLSPGSAAFLAQLEVNRLQTNPELDRMELGRLQNHRAQVEKSISNLVFSLIKTVDKAAYDYIIAQIDTLHKENASLQKRINELDTLTGKHPLADLQVDAMKELLELFQSGFEDMSVEQKRAVLRALIEKVVWDGERAQVYLFGAGTGGLEAAEA